MEKNIISTKQFRNIIILFVLGSTIITGTSTAAKKDSYLGIIFATLLAIPLVLIYTRISSLYPGKDLFEIFMCMFGKKIGLIFCWLYVLYAIQLGSLVIRNFTEYIQNTTFPETPQYVFAILLGVFAFWTLRHGIELLGRGCSVILPVVILIVLFAFTFTIKDMNIGNIKPFFSEDFSKILSVTFTTLTFPFGEVVLMLAIFPSVKKDKSHYKTFITSIIIAGFLILLVMLRNILVLGIELADVYYFSSYYSASVLSLGDFISSVEVLVAGNFIVTGLAKITVCLYAATLGLATIFKIDTNKKLLACVMLLIVALSCIAYNNIFEMIDYIYIYRYYALIFQLIIPVIIFIVAEVKNYRRIRATA